MKKQLMKLIVMSMVLAALGCGSGPGGSSSGGTETGTTNPVSSQLLASRVEAVANALVPNIKSSGLSSLSKALTYGTSTQWANYLDSTNVTVLTDVFGDPDVDPRVVTKIRVLIDDFGDTVERLFSSDPDVTCSGAKALNEGDSITISFLGAISNGTATDRFFDCQALNESGYNTIYGKDSNDVIRIVNMWDVASENSTSVSERGDSVRVMQVVYATYVEANEDGSDTGYLDIQYAQASIYEGIDGVVFTSDDVLFKSRSRITGRATLDSSGMVTAGTGDFTVTKYDRGFNSDGTAWTYITKTIGRGNYSADGVSLFKIDSNMSSLTGNAGTFCIQMPAAGSGLPSDVESSNCSALETAYAWAGHTFPFDLSPALDGNFEDKDFIEGNDTDMIGNTGDNFSIPTYSTTAVSATPAGSP